MTTDEEAISTVGDAIRDAEAVVALTGAGISTPSGIPDFRGEDGLWERHDPGDFRITRFEADPEGFWRDRLDVVDEVFGGDVAPNAAHEALADLEAAGHLDAVVTQNVDGLHQAAGSEDVVEVHGNGDRVACRSCDRRFDAEPAFERVRAGEEVPPTCEHCGGTLKPDVVLFGEQLPEHALYRAQHLAERVDVLLAVGSSLTVQPIASLPGVAADGGATLVVVNREPTPVSDRADHDLRADVTDALPRLRDAVVDGT